MNMLKSTQLKSTSHQKRLIKNQRLVKAISVFEKPPKSEHQKQGQSQKPFIQCLQKWQSQKIRLMQTAPIIQSTRHTLGSTQKPEKALNIYSIHLLFWITTLLFRTLPHYHISILTN